MLTLGFVLARSATEMHVKCGRKERVGERKGERRARAQRSAVVVEGAFARI
jgi:hypothetical protein